MSGQIISGEVIHVSYPDHSYICANFYCKNILTDFELMKLKQSPLSKVRSRFNYCMPCRRSKNVDMGRCDNCNCGFSLTQGRSTTARYCILCKNKKEKARMKIANTNHYKRIINARPSKVCRTCSIQFKSQRTLYCSKICSDKHHNMVRCKNNTELIAEIKANRSCEECYGPLDIKADFRVRYCSTDCKKKSHAKLFVGYRKRDRLINKDCIS